MDFNKLYTLLVEANEPLPEDELTSDDNSVGTDGTGVATPDAYDIEPAPIAPGVDHGETTLSIKSYIDKLSSFADELNGADGESLNDYINRLDTDGSAFEGISNLKKKVISAAVDLRSIIEDLNGYRIASQRATSAAPVVPPAPVA